VGMDFRAYLLSTIYPLLLCFANGGKAARLAESESRRPTALGSTEASQHDVHQLRKFVTRAGRKPGRL
jgi:hypothetical protein